MTTGSRRPLQTTIRVNEMEIDTGASVSIVSEETFNKIQEGQSKLELKPVAVRLQTYTGEPIPVLGSTLAVVEHGGQTASLPLIVTRGNGPTLLGRDWLLTLGKTCSRQKPERGLHCRRYWQRREVFEPGLGRLETKIYSRPNAQPQFHSFRSVHLHFETR